ncbi:PadR family transcriptional regulator [Streptacidiphilus sp. PB12-B1b]|uniref:PadR family transcriptional regulator n=1 Tax=Streptacidiphilus sp. PB12-B1b TaxID=2705012 RepID=UPI0015F88644|nr:PadR family transcriptional regulator [Streptacidiphilus sp. PB12-B1b]QMU79194.1 PadR family transcriptional regulator [Streptacidiphilus sp. PB12-B1b]
MSPVFAHGRLRLYLLKLLDEAPRHGYEVIRLLEERFHGLYAPSAGTVYPRLAKLEQEGLVAHTVEGGRKVYRITDAGRAELSDRATELDALEAEIRDSVSQLADQIREDVRDSAQDLREEMRRAAKESKRQTKNTSKGWGPDPVWGAEGPWPGMDKEAWQRAKEEWRQAKEQAREQTRQAKEQARSAREEARAAREQTRAVRDQVRAEAHRVGEQMRAHAKNGDWPTGLAEGLAELTRTLSGLADPARWGASAEPGAQSGSDCRGQGAARTGERTAAERVDLDPDRVDPDKDGAAPEPLPDWAETDASGDPLRELLGLLDRFRDEVRDHARDEGVTPAALARARAVLAAAARRLRD